MKTLFDVAPMQFRLSLALAREVGSFTQCFTIKLTLELNDGPLHHAVLPNLSGWTRNQPSTILSAVT